MRTITAAIVGRRIAGWMCSWPARHAAGWCDQSSSGAVVMPLTIARAGGVHSANPDLLQADSFGQKIRGEAWALSTPVRPSSECVGRFD